MKLLIELAKDFPNFGYVKEEAAPIPARILALAAAKPPIRNIFALTADTAGSMNGGLAPKG